MGKKTITNSLYLFGVLEESAEFQNWKKEQPDSYIKYRKAWMSRPENKEPGEFPLALNIEVTTNCNLACTFCWHKELKNDEKFNMDFSLFKKIIDEASSHKIPSVNLNGLGEPMLHPDLMKMIKYCKDKGIPEVQFHTNATIMNEKLATSLIEAGLDNIIFSLDSPDKETYEAMRIKASFDSVQKNVHTFLDVKNSLNKIKPFVRVTMVLTDKTTKQVEDFVQKWTSKVDSITVQDMLYASNSDAGNEVEGKFKSEEKSRIDINSSAILDFQKENNIGFVCPYLYQSLKIKSSGKVQACSPREAPTLGYVSDTLKTIWDGNNINRIRKLHEKGEWMSVPQCAGCDVPFMELNRMMKESELVSEIRK